VSESYIKAVHVWKRQDLKNLHPSDSEIFQAWITTILFAPLHYLGKLIVYKKIQQAMGGKVKQLICGGGSIAQHLEDFFEIVGIDILVGYGLTETSPVLTARRPQINLRGSSGLPIANTELKIVDLETHKLLPQGQRGLVMAKGPQIMQGYYLNPEATRKAIDSEGWFDTGDIGWLTPDNQIVLTGRAKDTIVLTNGENIEPQAIEDACVRSALIDQIIVVGQDQKQLGALIVPNLAGLEAAKLIPAGSNLETVNLETEAIKNIYREELNREVKDRSGYTASDRIGVFSFILQPFAIDNGLMTQTFKIKRNVVNERYQDIINKMFV